MGISIWQLLIVLLIIVVVFGTKKLRNTGGDLGAAIKNFRTSMKDSEEEKAEAGKDETTPPKMTRDKASDEEFIEGEVTAKRRDP